MKSNLGAQPEDVAYVGFVSPDPVPGLPQLINLIGETRRGPGFHYQTCDAQHQSRRVVLQLTLAGCCRCRRGAAEWLVAPGQAVVFIQPVDDLTIDYAPESREPLRLLICGFEGQTAESVVQAIRASGPVMNLPLAAPIVRRLQGLLPDDGWVRRRIDARSGAELIWEILTSLAVAAHHSECRHPPLLDAAMDLMLAGLDAVTVAGVARRLGISRVHLDRLFRQHLGTPPGCWLRSQRLATARSQLRDTNLALDAIAAGCGFGSATALIATFRQHYGLTPGAWRKAGPSKGDIPPSKGGS